MEIERKALRAGVTFIAAAALLRLLCSGVLQPVADMLRSREVFSFLLYLQTGYVACPAPSSPETEPADIPVTTSPTEPDPIETQPFFTGEDARLVSVSNACGYEADIESLLLQPLELSLVGDEPTVLILHTHTTESYAPNGRYTESSPYRTLDAGYNMVSIGAHVARILESNGVHVLHATTLHDHPSYSSAYNNARSTITSYLKQYPSIQLVLDLHRDALSMDNEVQLRTHATVDGADSSQLMLVVGTDGSGLNHPNWQQNLSLAVKLHALLEKRWPGLCRSISFRSQRFNQDLSPGAMLIEVGAAGDTHDQALTAATALAEAILSLSG